MVSSSRPLGLLADVAAGVDVDGDERFGLVDDDRPARLQPDLALERLVDLALDAVLLEDGIGLGVQLHLGRQHRQDALHQVERLLIDLRAVDADGLEFVGQQVAEQLADQVLLPVDHRRRPRRLHPLADLGPDGVEGLQVGEDVFLGPAGRGGPDDDAAAESVRFTKLADDAAQPRPLVARFDLPRHADVVDRRHEHQEPSRHRHVRGEPGALGAERLLDHLDEDLLSFLEQILDLRLRTRLAIAAPWLAAASQLARGVPGARPLPAFCAVSLCLRRRPWRPLRRRPRAARILRACR